MTGAAVRFQFSLADVFAATVSLLYPVGLIVAWDLKNLDEPGFLGLAIGLGLLIGFCGAVQYRRDWNSNSAWFVPPFLIFTWSLFLLPYSNLQDWPSLAVTFYPPIFLGLATGILFHKRKRRYAILIATVAATLFGFVLVECFKASVRSRIFARERAAAAFAIGLANAQEMYHRTDYDKDEVLEYTASPRELLESKSGAADVLLIDAALAGADTTRPNPKAIPIAGHFIRALNGDGPNAPGGAKSYSDSKGNRTGYGFVVYPSTYKRTGFATFIVSTAGIVYQKDLGPETRKIAEAMTVFDPDTSWVPSE